MQPVGLDRLNLTDPIARPQPAWAPGLVFWASPQTSRGSIVRLRDLRGSAWGAPAGSVRPLAHVAAGAMLAFGGTSGDYVNFGDVANPGPDVSLAAWVRPSGSQFGRAIVAKYQAVPGDYELGTISASGAYYFRLWNSGGVAQDAADSVAHTNYPEAVLLVGTFRAGVGSALYVNGALRSSLGSFTRNTRTAQPLNLGRRAFGGAEAAFGGAVGDVWAWNRALAPGEVQALWRAASRWALYRTLRRTVAGRWAPPRVDGRAAAGRAVTAGAAVGDPLVAGAFGGQTHSSGACFGQGGG